MIEITETNREDVRPRLPGANMTGPDVKIWFVREVLPLEAALMRYLRRHWRNKSDLEDLCHDVYVRVYEAARQQIPHPAEPFIFAIARNLLVDHVRRDHIVSIEAVADLDALNAIIDEPDPDHNVIARDELRRLQAALDRLPRRCRQAVVMKQIDGLSRREIAARMGVGEETVKRHLANGMDALADILYGEQPDARRSK